MTKEEFLKCIRTSKKLIDDSMPYKNQLVLGDFLTFYDEYKYDIFKEYTVEAVRSDAFCTFVLHVMGLVKSLEVKSPLPDELPDNVLILNDYRQTTSLRAFG